MNVGVLCHVVSFVLVQARRVAKEVSSSSKARPAVVVGGASIS